MLRERRALASAGEGRVAFVRRERPEIAFAAEQPVLGARQAVRAYLPRTFGMQREARAPAFAEEFRIVDAQREHLRPGCAVQVVQKHTKRQPDRRRAASLFLPVLSVHQDLRATNSHPIKYSAFCNYTFNRYIVLLPRQFIPNQPVSCQTYRESGNTAQIPVVISAAVTEPEAGSVIG